jgi:acetoacetate decarboxylase
MRSDEADTSWCGYRGMPVTTWSPPTPQLIRGARMLIVGYAADPEALAEVLPPGLRPHPNNLVQINMYEVGADQTSGFGAFSLTYLTVEIDGHDSLAAEGALAIPGRYVAYYWNSSPRVLTYARETSGFPAMYGERRAVLDDGELTSVLSLDGRDVITMRAAVTENGTGTLGGHLNYYTRRQVPRPEGGRCAIDELIEIPIPFVVDTYDAAVSEIRFDFPDGHPAARLAPSSPLSTPSLMWADVTFTYSAGRVVVDYLGEV